MGNMKEKTVLVTGGSGVLGRAICKRCGREGAYVICMYNHGEERAGEIVREIQGSGGRAVSVQANVSDQTAVRAAVESAVKETGGIDLLVNLAGGPLGTGHGSVPFAEKDLDICKAVVELNLIGQMTVTHEVLPYLLAAGKGKIVNICSIDGLRGTKDPGKCDYAAAKAGIIGFSKSLAKELAEHRINVNVVSLGQFANGKEKDNSRPESWAKYGAGSVFNRFGEPDEAASLVAFLLGDESDYITGQNYIIGGGCYI